ncbi:MAG: dTDP-4-dehydrorhamnose reductase [Acidobacteriota bacterium]
MKILITGANGMVARAAANHCRERGDDVVALTRAEMDIADADAVNAVLGEHRPDAVINCAAYTDVDGAESHAEAARAANTVGVGNLAAATRKLDSRFVTISTDYIFDGMNKGFYTQRDTPNPGSVYAVTKYEGERLATERNAGSIIVRSGWIYGPGGTNFLSIMHRLFAAGKPITAIADSYGTPTFAGDLARRIRELAAIDMPCIFHVTNSGPGTSYYEFAQAVCEIGGFDPTLVTAVSNSSLSRPAPRPSTSKLACLLSEKFGLDPLPEWRDALTGFLKRSD